jgi:hypothetical protein
LFCNGFDQFYIRNGSKAGTYISSTDNTWTWRP